MFLVSPSSVCFDFSKFGWLGHVGSQIEFSVLVSFDFSNFAYLDRVGAWIEFSVLVFFFGFLRRGSVRVFHACFLFCFFLCVLRAFSFLFWFGFILFVYKGSFR